MTLLAPSILTEVYLWLALRDNPSAVLGANIYDIRSKSLDCRAYLQAAAQRESAVVLQGSLNALGQAETAADGTVHQGYLKPGDGAADLVAGAMNAVRDLVLLEDCEPPLFGIGLDHVDVSHDLPAGRATRFLKHALDTQLITHFVLDGSGLFKAAQRTEEAMEATFTEVSNFALGLLDGNVGPYLLDKEVCTGELNYVGGQTQAMIPTPAEMEIFVKLYQQKARERGLGAFNVRPTLFVGNLGTTHHNFDSGETAVEAARGWRDQISKYNFVSAVLHGTTNTHPDTLSRAADGCHKINVAGDFLSTIVKGLPQRLSKKLLAGEHEPKKMMPTIRSQMDAMSAGESGRLLDSLRAHCLSLLDTIKSPRLSAMDREYFRYKPFKFTPSQVEAILTEIRNQRAAATQIKSDKPADPRSGYHFAASMIEVPFDEHYKKYVAGLLQEGISHFHIDVGDGKFISRSFSGLEKTKYLRSLSDETLLHAHFMVENPHFPDSDGTSPIERYIKAGCNAVAVHERAFSRRDDLFAAFAMIRQLGARPGLILETFQSVDEHLFRTIQRADLDWIVPMGVPIGFGGQIFDTKTPQRVAALHRFAISRKRQLLIEIDGGLTLEAVRLCRQAGAQIFAGWSIVRGESVQEMRVKVRQVQNRLIGGE